MAWGDEWRRAVNGVVDVKGVVSICDGAVALFTRVIVRREGTNLD